MANGQAKRRPRGPMARGLKGKGKPSARELPSREVVDFLLQHLPGLFLELLKTLDAAAVMAKSEIKNQKALAKGHRESWQKFQKTIDDGTVTDFAMYTQSVTSYRQAEDSCHYTAHEFREWLRYVLSGDRRAIRDIQKKLRRAVKEHNKVVYSSDRVAHFIGTAYDEWTGIEQGTSNLRNTMTKIAKQNADLDWTKIDGQWSKF